MSFPGVPRLLSGNAPAPVIAILGSIESALWDLLAGTPPWGVYVAGTTTVAFEVDSVVELTVRTSAQTSDYRIQSGSFASFNKVVKPREVPIRLTKGGNEIERADFLAWLKLQLETTTQLDLVMPEGVIVNHTLVEYSIRRESRSGVTLIIADCLFQEVREVVAQYYNSADTSNAASPNNVPTTPTARVQGATPGASLLGAISRKVLLWQRP